MRAGDRRAAGGERAEGEGADARVNRTASEESGAVLVNLPVFTVTTPSHSL